MESQCPGLDGQVAGAGGGVDGSRGSRCDAAWITCSDAGAGHQHHVGTSIEPRVNEMLTNEVTGGDAAAGAAPGGDEELRGVEQQGAASTHVHLSADMQIV